MSEQMVPAVCCRLCLKFQTKDCPVKTASPWSSWKDFCSKYIPNITYPEARRFVQAFQSRMS